MTDKTTSYRFGDRIEMIAASDANPQKFGFYIRRGTSKAKFNGGSYIEMTDGKGEVWRTPPDNVRPAPLPHSSVQEAAPATAADGLADAAMRLLSDARYFARRWSDPKAVADYIDEQMACRGISAARVGTPSEVPEGWVLVRKEPTKEAEREGYDAAMECIHDDIDRIIVDSIIGRKVWAHMLRLLSAAPTAQGMGWQDTESAAHFLISHSLSQGCDRFTWKLEHDDPDGGIDQWVVEVRPNGVKLPSAPASTSAGEA